MIAIIHTLDSIDECVSAVRLGLGLIGVLELSPFGEANVKK